MHRKKIERSSSEESANAKPSKKKVKEEPQEDEVYEKSTEEPQTQLRVKAKDEPELKFSVSKPLTPRQIARAEKARAEKAAKQRASKESIAPTASTSSSSPGYIPFAPGAGNNFPKAYWDKSFTSPPSSSNSAPTPALASDLNKWSGNPITYDRKELPPDTFYKNAPPPPPPPKPRTPPPPRVWLPQPPPKKVKEPEKPPPPPPLTLPHGADEDNKPFSRTSARPRRVSHSVARPSFTPVQSPREYEHALPEEESASASSTSRTRSTSFAGPRPAQLASSRSILDSSAGYIQREYALPQYQPQVPPQGFSAAPQGPPGSRDYYSGSSSSPYPRGPFNLTPAVWPEHMHPYSSMPPQGNVGQRQLAPSRSHDSYNLNQGEQYIPERLRRPPQQTSSSNYQAPTVQPHPMYSSSHVVPDTLQSNEVRCHRCGKQASLYCHCGRRAYCSQTHRDRYPCKYC